MFACFGKSSERKHNVVNLRTPTLPFGAPRPSNDDSISKQNQREERLTASTTSSNGIGKSTTNV